MKYLQIIASVPACLALLFAAACGDNTRATTDSGTADTGTADTGTADTGTADTGTADTGTADTGTADAGSVTCFPLSTPTVDTPDAIPGAFDAATPTWMRPTGEVCPATGLAAEALPFLTVCYENDTGADADFLFEMGVGEEDLKPAIVIYDGDQIPADPQACSAVSSELVIDSAETNYVVPAGGKITFVATIQEAGMGEFQFVISPNE